MRERKYGGENRCRNPNDASNVSALENTRLLNAHQFMMYAAAAVISIGPAYARRTIRGNGNVPTARLQAMGVTKDMGRRIEDAQSSWHELTE